MMIHVLVYRDVERELLTLRSPVPLPVPSRGDEVTLHGTHQDLVVQVLKVEWDYQMEKADGPELRTTVWLSRL